jgi:phosphoribosylaminoimidazole (AIR) synthetase
MSDKDHNSFSKIKTVSSTLWNLNHIKNNISRKTYAEINKDEYNEIIKYYTNFIKTSYKKLVEHYNLGVGSIESSPEEERSRLLNLLEIVKDECILEIKNTKKELDKLSKTKSLDDMFIGD